ncbi:hypothetical protein EV13_1775 [Prochlorococcus sp. MIT 0702]|nr:hypothetical protein EV12_1488 [Prochlorococcus sp. MIT 0701]KGG27882.1 hypothetical protein EV13_1775 [Prochlorococcus sp. MIT 0702]KGG31395.1 hypothetical protein EV14_2346 [Prochlorococcus sp. MIT 0703]
MNLATTTAIRMPLASVKHPSNVAIIQWQKLPTCSHQSN